MKLHQLFIYTLLLLLPYFAAYSNRVQHPTGKTKLTTRIVSGQVTDVETGNPIPMAEVFISGTAMGTTTDKEGFFSLKVPDYECSLVVSHIQHKTFIQLIVPEISTLNIQLKEFQYEIRGIGVKGKNKRKKNLRIFYNYFCGEGRSPSRKITNDSVLYFQVDDTFFVAHCNVPLHIENRWLGYEIDLIIDRFELHREKNIGGNIIPFKSPTGVVAKKLTGYYYYKTSSSEFIGLLQGRRDQLFYGSYRHFLSSLFHNRLLEDGFVVWPFPSSNQYETNWVQSSGPIELIRTYRFDTDSLHVYYFKNKDLPPLRTTIICDKHIFHIRADGTTPDANFKLVGAMGQEDFVNSLPQDFVPTPMLKDNKSNQILIDKVKAFEENIIKDKRSDL